MGRKAIYRKFNDAYRELAARRLRECENVSELCREMRISRQLLYQWRDKLERKQAKLDPEKATPPICAPTSSSSSTSTTIDSDSTRRLATAPRRSSKPHLQQRQQPMGRK